MAKHFKVALAGNPNCGKTSIFNALTGTRQHVGNYPGVTVESKSGHFSIGDMEIELIENGNLTGKFIIAIDTVGAGIGETVLVTTGSSARLALHNTSAPADAVIVGIVD